MKKTIITIMAISTLPVYAGLNGLTAHSRANCLGFNESISWDATRTWDLRVTAVHHLNKMVNNQVGINTFPTDTFHTLATNNSLDGHNVTWREAQLHINDPMPNLSYFWNVFGTHYRVEGRKLVVFEETEAYNCNMYDGWWHSDHPERDSK